MTTTSISMDYQSRRGGLEQRKTSALLNFLLFVLAGIVLPAGTMAQLSGNKFIPGDYAGIAAAVSDLNTQGVGPGGVTFNVAAGHTELLSGRIDMTATGTLLNPVVFRKDPATSGANPLLTAYTGTNLAGTASPDGMWSLNGSDYVTIDGIDLQEAAANITTTTMMEYGYGLFKASGTDGASHNIIRNCTITLNRNNTVVAGTPFITGGTGGSMGIAVAACSPTSGTTVTTVTTPDGASSNNKFYSNTIQNVHVGIALTGFAGASPYTLCDTNNDIGGSSASTGNTIINFGGGTTPASACAAIYFSNQWGLNFSYNTVNNNNGSGLNHGASQRGVWAFSSSAGASCTISNNNITIQGGASTSAIDWCIDLEMAQSGANGNTININNNTISATKTAATTAAFTAIWVNSAASTVNINGNTISNFTYAGTGTTEAILSQLAGIGTLNISNNNINNNNFTGATGTHYGIGVTATVVNALNITGNSFNGRTYTGATSRVYRGIYVSTAVATATHTVSGNNFQNMSYSGGTPTGEFSFIYSVGTAAAHVISNNTVTGSFAIPSTGSTYLIYNSQSSASATITNNNMTGSGISRTGASGLLYGYFNGSSPTGTATIEGNTFSNITVSGTTNLYGIYLLTSVNCIQLLRNNTVTNLTAGTGTLYGINHNYGNTGSEISGNTVNTLSGGSTTAGINIGATASNSMNVFNNIVHSVSTSGASAATGILHSAGTLTSIYKNKIYNITGNNAGASAAGLTVSGGTTVTLSNNIVGDIKAPLANAANAVMGINISGGTTVVANYNTVYLNASSSGAVFGSSALSASSTTNLTLRNNMLINNSAFNTTGLTVAYRRSTTSLATHNIGSNGNILYAGVPGANNILFYDGTNADQNIAVFKQRVYPADLNSATENVAFLSTSPALSTFLHVDPAFASYTESGAANISGIIEDYDGDIRQSNPGYAGTGTAPDIGADEYNGIAIPAPAAPVNFASNSVTINSFNITWDDNSTTEYGFIVYRSLSAGGPFLPVGSVVSTTLAGTGTTYSLAQSGLLGNTTYYFQVVAVAAASSAALSGSAATAACSGGLSGAYLIPTAYPTLQAALADLKLLGMAGAVTLELEATYTGAGETYPLIVSDTIGCLNAVNTLTLRPEASVAAPLVITSADTATTIDINGADYFTLDGRPGGTGSNKFLVVQNTSTTAAAAGNAIRIRNEARNNIITHADVMAANANPATNSIVTASGSMPGAIAILSTTGLFGNDYNTISSCNIHSTGTNLGVGIYAANGSAAGSTANNDSNNIINNNIYDFYLSTGAHAGLVVVAGNNNWTISGNSLYQTASRTIGGTQAVRGLWITPNTGSLTSASGFNISNNYIGGSAALAGGSPYTMTGTGNYNFYGMDISVGVGTATSVQNNTLANMNITGGFSGNSVYGINIANGNVNVGILGGNTVGSAVSNASIVINTTVTGGSFIGLRSGAGGTINFSNNTVAGIEVAGNATTVAGGFNGIAGSGGATIIVNNNTIGSATLANSIHVSAASATSTTATAVRGIICNSGTTGVVNTITNNLVANINNNYSATGTQGNTLVGIAVTTGAATISGNTVRNLSSNTQTSASGSTGAIIGINYTSTTAPAVISGNTVHSLRLTHPTATTAINAAGLFYAGPSGNANVIEKNLIHSVSMSSAANTAGFLTGMDIGSGTATIKNNMIRLGLDENGADITSACTVRGITKNAALANIWNNSVWVGGNNVASSAVNTFAFARTGTAATDDIRNNIFANVRSNAASGAKHYAINLVGTATLVLDYNDYIATGNGGVFGAIGTTDYASYTTNWVAGDANSYSLDPLFINAGGTAATVDLHIDPVNATIIEGTGAAIASVSDDFDGQSRAGLTPNDIGADAGNFVSLVCNGVPAGGTVTGSANALCVSGTKTMNLANYTNVPGITLQWQESAVPGGPYTNVTGGTGATTASYTTAVISTPMYYVCQVTCSNGGASALSTEFGVTVNNPTVATTTPGSRCGTGTVNLSASGNAGAGIRWFAGPTGGSTLSVGDNFTTPVISSSTTYYAEASVMGAPAFGGRMNTLTAGSALGASPRGVIFNTTKDLEIDSIGFLCTGPAATISVQLYNAGGTATIGSPASINIPANAGTSSVPVLVTVPVSIQVPAAGTYRIFVSSVNTGSPLYYEFSGVTGYPYAVGTDLSITSSVTSLTGTASLTTYYYFYKLNVKTSCVNDTRVPVVATVTPPPAFGISASQTVCNGAPAMLTVTSNLADYDSYVWSPVSNLFLDAAGTSPYTGTSEDTVYYISTTQGPGVITCNASNSSTLCTSVANTTISVQPASIAAVATPAEICVSGSAVLSLTPAIAYPAGSIQWQVSNDSINFTDIPGATSSSYATPVLSATAYYQALMKDGNGTVCDTTPVYTLLVVNPQISSITPTLDTCSGSVVTLTAVANDPSYVINWYNGGSGGTSLGTGANFSFTANGTVTRYAQVSYGSCVNTVRVPVQVNVAQNPTAIIASVNPDNICVAGGPVTLNVGSHNGQTGNPTWEFQWTDSSGTVILQPWSSASSFSTTTVAGLNVYRVYMQSTLCPGLSGFGYAAFNVGITGSVVMTSPVACAGTGSLVINAAGAGAWQNWYNNNFSTPALGSANIYNNAAVTGGVLQLHTGLASQSGALEILNPSGVTSNEYKIEFDLITSNPSGSPADGVSYSFGDDVSATATVPNFENGTGTKLKLAFDAYTNGTNTAGIYLMYNCNVTNQAPNTAGVLAYVNDVSWRNNASQHIIITVNALGQVSLEINGKAVFANLQLPASYLSSDHSAWKHVFKSRTGAEFLGVAIDNLDIDYRDFQFSINGPTGPWQSSKVYNNLALGTYDVYIRNPADTTCQVNLGSYSVAYPAPFSTLSTDTIVCISKNVTLSLSSNLSGATYQWQSSSSASGPFTDIPGATSATYASLISSDTYFQCVISCGGSPVPASPSSVRSVLVNNPQVTGTTPGSRCGIGTVNLSATGSAGTSLNWYAAASGGLPIGTGTTFTTPSISSTTSFYVAATSNGGSSYTPVPGGNTWNQYQTGGAFQTGLISGASMVFDALTSITIASMDIYPSAAVGTPFTIEVRQTSSSGALIASYSGVTTVTNSGTPSVAQTVPVNLVIPAGVDYVIGFAGTNPNTWRSGSTAMPYPFTLPGYISIKSSSFGSATGGTNIYIYYLYNWVVSTNCESARVPVAATVLAPPSLNVTPASSICAGDSLDLTVSSVNDPDYSYVWIPGSFNGSSYKVSPSANTTYTLTATDTTAGPNAGCVNVATVSVQVNPNPSIDATPATANICGGGTQTLTVSNTGVNNFTISGTSPTSGTVIQNPFYRNWEGVRSQYMIRASELLAQGVSPGNINSVSFNVTAISNATANHINYNLKAGLTSATDLAGTWVASLPVKYFNANLTPVVGVNTFNFSSPLYWDGVSNIVVEVCFDNDPTNTCSSGTPVCWGNYTSTSYATAAFTASRYYYADNTGISNRNMCDTSALTGSSTLRPVMTFGVLNNLSYLWSPATGLDNPSSATPTATVSAGTNITYYVTATNTLTGCTSTDSVQISSLALPKPVIADNDTTLCNPNFIYVNVADTGAYMGGYPAGTTFTWSAIGVPIPDLDSISSVNGSTYYVTITLPNGCSATSDTATILTKSVAIVDVITNASCAGADGSILATVTSGLPPFQYIWSTDLAQTNIVRNVTKASSKDTLLNLSAGTYYLQVYDEAGQPGSCNSGVLTYVVSGSNPIVATTSGTNISCNGFADGSATVSWTGGTSPFTILWSDGFTTASRSVFAGGTLTVIVSDQSGCADTASVTINEPAALALSLSSTPETAPGALNGTATALASGGTPGYLYDWYDAGFTPVGSGSTVGGLAGGTYYYCLVTDTNGCQFNDTIGVITNVITNATLNLTALLEGYHNGTGGMVPALLNSGVGVSATETDTIRVELRDALSPVTVIGSGTAVISTGGQASFSFPSSVIGNSYYIAVFHRNAVQTWSALPVTFSASTSYDFSSGAGQAYGSNMIAVLPGVYAFYSGDLAPQDEFIDILDQAVIDNDIFNFASGYVISDLNGDGFVDIIDQAIVDNNIFNFIGSVHP